MLPFAPVEAKNVPVSSAGGPDGGDGGGSTADLTALLVAGRHAEAEARALAALSAGAKSPVVLRLAGAAYRGVGRLGEALTLLARAVAAAPADPDGWVALAMCQLAARQPEAVVRTCEDGLARLPGLAGLVVAKAQALQSMSRVAEAERLFRDLAHRDPGNPQAAFGLATLAIEAGDWEGAAAAAAPLTRGSNPGPEAEWLAARIAFGRGEVETARTQALRVLGRAGLTPLQRAQAELLLSQALDALGRPEASFEAAARGKRAQREFYAGLAAGRELDTDKARRLASWFADAAREPWRQAPPPAHSGVRAHAFLIGFARSGTTLLEQALAGHPDLVSLEEAPTLERAYLEFMTSSEGLERLSRLSEPEAAIWRADYWREVARGGVDAGGRVFLDKAPAGTLYLPLVAKLFPRAKVLFALRDPRDVVLSCFRSDFQINALTYAFTDLAETVRCYAASMRLASIYRERLPLEMLDIRYERLVDDFAGELGRVAAFLGLTPDEVMLDVAATAQRRIVRTPSASQVRAGLNREGVGRWRAFARQLAPVMDELAPWIERFGYGAG